MNPWCKVLIAFLWLAAAGPLPASAAEPLTHHEIDMKFEPETRRLEVTDHISLGRRGDVAFRLAEWLTVERATIDGIRVAPRRVGNLWRFSSPGNTRHELALSLSGTVPALPQGKARRGSNGAVASLAGSYLPGFAAWIADTGDAWLTYVLRVEIMGEQRAVAPGRITSEARDDVSFRATFVAEYPSELPSLFVGPYRVDERRIGKVRLRTYFHQEITAFSAQYLTTAAGYIREFADRIGDYPFDDFHIVSSPLPVGLGFPNLTYIGRMIVPLPFMRGRSLAHEVMHNWWGNGVAVDYMGGNWAEGLTTYMADYRLAATQSPQAGREMRLGWLRDFTALPSARDVPVTDFTTKTHQASQVIGYNKVAHIFHMLHQQVGDDRFRDGLRLFWKRHSFRTAGWTEIQAAFEELTGQNLDWFFRQWLDRPGAPLIELAAAKVLRDEKGDAVSVSLRQAKPVYRVAVPIEIETATETVREIVRLDEVATTVSVRLPGKPLRISVDPDFDVFRRLLKEEGPPILRDITLSQKVRTIILDTDAAFLTAAASLAGRLLDVVSIGDRGNGQGLPPGPALVIGSEPNIAAFIKRVMAQAIPKEVGAGTASAWVARTIDGHPVLFVRARDAAALQALIRPLPHYGSQSFIVFDGHRAIQKGIWRVTSSPLSLEFAK